MQTIKMAFLNYPILVALSFALLSGCEDKAGMKTKEQPMVHGSSPKSMNEIYSGYQSDSDAWVGFLRCWRFGDVKRFSRKKHQDQIPKHQLAVPVSDRYENNAEKIATLEAKLNQSLPKSYVDFLLVSGGVWFVANAGHDYVQPGLVPSHFLQIPTVDYFRNVDLVNWQIWSDNRGQIYVSPGGYYLYCSADPGEKWQDPALYKPDSLDYLLKIGELEQGVILLLNTREVTGDGEWEAWLLSPQVGAVRYRSFAEMMLSIYYEETHPEEGGLYISIEKLVGTCADQIKTIITP